MLDPSCVFGLATQRVFRSVLLLVALNGEVISFCEVSGFNALFGDSCEVFV